MLVSSLPRATGAAPSSFGACGSSFKRFVVLKQRSSSGISSRSSSTCSDDELTHDDSKQSEQSIVYESYAAVLSRYRSGMTEALAARSLRWGDLQQPRNSAWKTSAVQVRYRTRRARSADDLLEMFCWENCFEFLDADQLVQMTMVCSGWHEIITKSPLLWLNIYSRKWQRAAPFSVEFMALEYRQLVQLCRNRHEDEGMEVSTRGSVTVLTDRTSEIVNNSMLRNFAHGAIDSVRGTMPLRNLSCAQALGVQVCYFEVELKGSGSVGVVSLSDESSRHAYGFGSAEHVGWKGISYGYHGNDGDFVYNDGTAPYGGVWKPLGPSWGGNKDKPVVVGCGIDARKRQVFFTLNGAFVGVVPTEIREGEYTPALSLHSFGDSAKLNVGSAPFEFDIESHCVHVSK